MAAPTPLLPALDWSITLPETLLFHGKHNPDLPVFVFARDGSQNISAVTYRRFMNACRRIPDLLGITRDEAKTRPVIAIVANTDTLIYHTIVLGLMLAGAVVRFLRLWTAFEQPPKALYLPAFPNLPKEHS